MRSKPLMIAISIGTAILLIYQLAALALTYFLVYPAIQEILDSPLGVPGAEPVQVINLSFITSLAGLCLGPLAYGAIGIVYAFLHQREDPISSDQGAVGGAAASGVARALSGVLGLLLTSITSYYLLSPALFFSEALGEMPPEALIFSFIGSAAGSFISLCFGVIFAGFIGALGGGLGAFLLNR